MKKKDIEYVRKTNNNGFCAECEKFKRFSEHQIRIDNEHWLCKDCYRTNHQIRITGFAGDGR